VRLRLNARLDPFPITPTDHTQPMKKKTVLYVCIHNSARSQMAEAWLKHFCGDEVHAESAGLEPGTLNPLAVEVMREVGIDISRNKTQSVFDLFTSGRLFNYVITVCDGAAAERCPIFVGVTTRVHWSFPDPSAVTGTHEQKLQQVREIRDMIRDQVEAWCATICKEPAAV